MTEENIYIMIIIAVIVFAFLIWWRLNGEWEPQGGDDESPAVRAGKEGEREATEIIGKILKEGDILLTNVCISYDEKEAELDNVVINNRGVFIIEVKNYSGTLAGEVNDYEWTKYKTSRGGNVYQKQARNPIRQVRRQVYILSRYLKYYGVYAWVEGYVLLLNNNSPVRNEMVLETLEEIDRAIHKKSKNPLNKKTVAAIKEIL